jgi:hypothetical protein
MSGATPARARVLPEKWLPDRRRGSESGLMCTDREDNHIKISSVHRQGRRMQSKKGEDETS